MSLINKLKNAKEQYIDKNENMQNLLAKTKSLANEASDKLKEITNKDSSKEQNISNEKLENLILDSTKKLEKIINEAYNNGYKTGFAHGLESNKNTIPYKVEIQEDSKAIKNIQQTEENNG